jgi:hypothetical protein
MPETDDEFRERMGSIGHIGKHAGKSRIRNLVEGGKVRGVEIDHSDGSVEAVVRPATNEFQLSLKAQ